MQNCSVVETAIGTQAQYKVSVSTAMLCRAKSVSFLQLIINFNLKKTPANPGVVIQMLETEDLDMLTENQKNSLDYIKICELLISDIIFSDIVLIY